MNPKKILAIVLPMVGLLALAAYFNFTVFGIPLSDRVELLLAFAIGPMAILGMVKVEKQLSEQYGGMSLRIGIVFSIIAFSMFCLMVVVQQAIFANYRTLLAGAEGAAAKETIKQIYNLVNPVQLGVDVTFDIFYCIGLAGLSVVLLKMETKRKLLGVYGLIVASGLLFLNLLSFPTPPAESNLIDLGPATGIFWLLLIISLYFEKRKRAKEPERGNP